MCEFALCPAVGQYGQPPVLIMKMIPPIVRIHQLKLAIMAMRPFRMRAERLALVSDIFVEPLCASRARKPNLSGKRQHAVQNRAGGAGLPAHTMILSPEAGLQNCPINGTDACSPKTRGVHKLLQVRKPNLTHLGGLYWMCQIGEPFRQQINLDTAAGHRLHRTTCRPPLKRMRTIQIWQRIDQ